MYLFIVLILLSIAAYFDWRTLKIPNWVHWVGIGVAIIVCIFRINVIPIEKMALNAALVFIPLCLLWGITTLVNFKAIGAGDVKLFGVAALFIPLGDTYLLLLMTIVLSSLIALFKIRSGRFLEMFNDLSFFLFYGIPGKSDSKMQKVPLGPILLIAFAFYLTPYYDLFSSYWR